ncbi:MAG TPA: cupin domain-containing protein [Acidobacteriaceae bacterium]|nr:cupin domain-containing protein [Acidobacteriaceae bacterium]
MMRLTRRDVSLCLLSIVVTAAALALGESRGKVLGQSAYDWNSIPAQNTPTGETRHFFRGPTPMLDQLEVHATTLNPGVGSHPPEKRAHEEVIIIDRGEVEAYVNGTWTKLGPGSVILNTPNQLQAIRNAGSGPATYHVISWISRGAPQQAGQ